MGNAEWDDHMHGGRPLVMQDKARDGKGEDGLQTRASIYMLALDLSNTGVPHKHPTTDIPFPLPGEAGDKNTRSKNNHCWRPNYGEQPVGAVYRLCFGGNVLIYAVPNI